MNKTVCYTCVTGGYDTLKEVPQMEGIDFICFTDDIDIEPNGWTIKPIPDNLKYLSNVKKQRIIKLCPHRYLKEYSTSIWTDANIQILGDLNDILKTLDFSKTSMYVRKHPTRDCIYQEADACKKLQNDKADVIDKQMRKYKDEGFPKHFGLSETNILFRKHNDISLVLLMNRWAQELLLNSHRDQLSFTYACWKQSFRLEFLDDQMLAKHFKLKKHEKYKINRKITINKLFENSYVISIDKKRYDIFNAIFNRYFNNLSMPKLIVGNQDKTRTNIQNCKDSHIKIVKIAKEKKLPYVLIFEDDAYPSIACKVKLANMLRELPTNISLILLGWSSYNSNNQKFNRRLNKVNGFFAGAHAYILFQNAYDKYLNFFKSNPNGTADGMIFKYLENAYVADKSLFIQYCQKKSMNDHIGYIYNDPNNISKCLNKPIAPIGFQLIEDILSNKPLIAVSMTSWIKRIKNCKNTINSILSNTIQPDIIYLNLSHEEFPKYEDDLPNDLLDLINKNEKIVINWIDGPNTKTFKKVLPTLDFLNDDDIIISIDDDIIYPKDVIKKLLIDWNKYHIPITINEHKIKSLISNDSIFYHCGALSIFPKKCLRDYKKYLTDEIISTNEDDKFYTTIAQINGYMYSNSNFITFNTISQLQNDNKNGSFNKNNIQKNIQIFQKNFKLAYKKIKRLHLIHWYIEQRESLQLKDIEKFHIKLLKKFNIENKVDKIVFSLVIDDINNINLIEYIKSEIKKLFSKANIDIVITQNKRNECEYITFKKIKDYYNYDQILYTHFKGVTGIFKPKNYNYDILDNEKYWSYLMYKGLLSNDGYNQMINSFNNGKFLYGASIVSNNNDINFINAQLKPFFNSKIVSSLLQNKLDNYHFNGTFYWINIAKFKNILSNIKLEQLFTEIEKVNHPRTHISEFLFPAIFHLNQLGIYKNLQKYRLGYNSYTLKQYKDDGYIDEFENILKTKIVVYSFSCNNIYHKPLPDIQFKSPYIDYVMFCDDIKEGETIRNGWILKPVVKTRKCIQDENKFVKWHPFEFFNFENYDYSIYMDSKCKIVKNPLQCIADNAKNMKYGFACHIYDYIKEHYEKNYEDVYKHIDYLVGVKVGDVKNLLSWKQTLQNEKFPINSGVIETAVIITDLTSMFAKNIQEQIYNKYIEVDTRRDQVVVPYVLLKNNIQLKNIGILGKYCTQRKYFVNSCLTNVNGRER